MAYGLPLVGGGLLGTVSQVAVLAGTLVLVLMVVALGSFAYKSLSGDGIEWPDEQEVDDDTVNQGDEDDEWEYY